MRQFIGSVRDDTTVRDLLVVRGAARGPRGRATAVEAAELAIMARRRRGRPDGVRAGARATGATRRLRGRDAVGHVHHGRARRPVRAGAVPRGAHAVRRRAEAAGAGGAAARPRRGAAARRAGQLPRRAGQALAGGAAAARPARRCCSSATTGSCWPAPPSGSSRVERARPAPTLGARRRLRHLPRGAARSGFARLEELRRRWDEEHARLKELVLHAAAAGRDQPRHGLPLPGDADPAARSSRRPGRRRSRRASRTSRCGCAAAAPACGR